VHFTAFCLGGAFFPGHGVVFDKLQKLQADKSPGPEWTSFHVSEGMRRDDLLGLSRV